MNLIGCLDTPTDGHYELSGQSVAKMKKDELATVRNRRVGFVFQNFNLLPQISSFENVEMPLLFGGVSRRQRHQRVEELMERVGLGDRMDHKPTEDIVLADEPTGNLDSSSGGDIMELFAELWEQGRTMVVITHDAALARRANRQVEIHDGLITRDTRS
jgi:putative ABC transport system ATP-binding protein